ncbi:MAG TPA: VanZ family protein [Clostridia bacterium]|nr:VanZ family protein [Clostridia bacterium]
MLLGYVVRVLPVIALFSLLIYLPIYFSKKRRLGKRPFVRHLVVYAFIGCCLSLLYLTVLWYYPYITFHPGYYMLNLEPFIWMREVYSMGAEKMFRQLAMNILMFVPYGLLLPMTFDKMKKLWKTALCVLFTTAAIETLQYFMGRSADVDDVIMNFTGGIAGYLLFLLLQAVLGEKRGWKNALGRLNSAT